MRSAKGQFRPENHMRKDYLSFLWEILVIYNVNGNKTTLCQTIHHPPSPCLDVAGIHAVSTRKPFRFDVNVSLLRFIKFRFASFEQIPFMDATYPTVSSNEHMQSVAVAHGQSTAKALIGLSMWVN